MVQLLCAAGAFLMAKTKKEAEKTVTNKENEINNILKLISLLNSVDIHSPEAELNKTTISDGKGGRIHL